MAKQTNAEPSDRCKNGTGTTTVIHSKTVSAVTNKISEVEDKLVTVMWKHKRTLEKRICMCL